MNNMNRTKRVISLAFMAALTAATISTGAPVSAENILQVSVHQSRVEILVRMTGCGNPPAAVRVFLENSANSLPCLGGGSAKMDYVLVHGGGDHLETFDLSPGVYWVVLQSWPGAIVRERPGRDARDDFNVNKQRIFCPANHCLADVARAGREQNALVERVCCTAGRSMTHEQHSCVDGNGRTVVTVNGSTVDLSRNPGVCSYDPTDRKTMVSCILDAKGRPIILSNDLKPASLPAAIVASSVSSGVHIQCQMKPGFYTYVQTAMSEQELAKRTKFRMPWEKRQQISLPGVFFKSTPFDEFGCPLAAAHDGPVTEIHFTVNT